MARKRLRAVIFGPQGSGKGTQGQLLAERLDVPLIGAGDLCRAEIAEGTPLGRLMDEYVSHGMLAPDELVHAIILKRLAHVPMEKGFILDGFPRNVEQAGFFDKFCKLTLAIHLKMPDAVAVERLAHRRQCPKCKSVYHLKHLPPAIEGICALCKGELVHRDDDVEEVIRKRLAVYHFMTEPMVVYYRARGVLLSVNADQPVRELFDELIKKMGKLGFSV